MSEFGKELSNLINRHSQENGSNTPDFILAEYIQACLDNFNKTTKARDKWYGVHLTPGISTDKALRQSVEAGKYKQVLEAIKNELTLDHKNTAIAMINKILKENKN